jgi:excisionase family DNA binding protein
MGIPPMAIHTTPLPPAPNRFEPLLTPAEAAEFYLKIHPKTLIRMAREGSIPALRLGKHWRFRVSDVEFWVASKVNSSRQPAE